MVQLRRTAGIAAAVVFSFLVASAFAKRSSGPWFMIPKGLSPRNIHGQAVNHDVILITPDKKKPEEKLIDAQFEFTKKIGPLGALIEVYQRNCGDDKWLSPDVVKVPLICDPRVPSPKDFWKCFSGKLNLDCTVDAGNYTLKGWDVEKELHHFFDKLEYKCYKIRFCFFVPNEQSGSEIKCVWAVEVKAQVEDQDYKGMMKKKSKNKKTED